MRFTRKLLIAILFFFIHGSACAEPLPLHLIELPKGFQIDIFAQDIPNARSMALGEEGVVFVGTRKGNRVYILIDENRDGRSDKTHIIEGVFESSPNGVAYRDGNLYVGEIGRVLRFDNILENLPSIPTPVVVNDSFPTNTWHGWKVIRFGPDGKLYIPVGAPCNVCEREDPRFASMMRMNKDGSEVEIFAKGIRNTVGYDWDPRTDELWFTDNGRDHLGDNSPPDELNHAPRKGMHFGFPYCHGGGILDPEFGAKRSCADVTVAAQELGPHVASLGMRFYRGVMFPKEYKNQIFIAEHGSWNRSTKIGYRITLVRVEDNKPISYEVFAKGWKQGENVWGRPVDVLNMPDGSLLVSDDYAGAIYRITYEN